MSDKVMIKKIKNHWIDGVPSRQISPPSAILIGAPDDRGVLNVGGRLGAGHGPAATRAMLANFMLGIEGAIGRVELYKGADIAIGETIEEGHSALRTAVHQSLSSGTTPIVIGGGHDYGYPHIAGASDFFKGKVALINCDAHLDVRPPTAEGITSGSPFYLALENRVIRPASFVEFGIQEHCNDESHYRYLKKLGVKTLSLSDVRQGRGAIEAFKKLVAQYSRKGLKTIVSFDVDSVQMAHAPGVSAPLCDGFTPEELLAMASFCGECRDVASIGFFELAPPLDENQKTTRLVATAIHRFLSGLSLRDAKPKLKKKGRAL
jgi:formiminoglutamase